MRRGTGDSPRVLIVGGSLAGLTLALRLEREGLPVTVLERERQVGAGSAGLGVDRPLLGRITGERSVADLPVITTNRDSTAWRLLYDRLRSACAARGGVRLEEGCEVLDVEDHSAGVRVRTRNTCVEGDVLVGADGYRSLVRRRVAPDAPVARYAGYSLWRGLTDEAEIPEPRRLKGVESAVSVQTSGDYRLVAYHVPGRDGATTPGRRRISWAWYDAHAGDLLETAGCVRDGEVLATLSGAAAPADTVERLLDLAGRLWPDPWRAALQSAIAARRFINTPVAQYRPERLVRGRLALVGDAAHVASPMTGSGFHYAMLDADALGAALGRSRLGTLEALRDYERARLADDQALADYGASWGRGYVAAAGRAPGRAASDGSPGRPVRDRPNRTDPLIEEPR